jgi:hypothetical protein
MLLILLSMPAFEKYAAKAQETNDDEPLLSFVVMSDTHVSVDSITSSRAAVE